jgi:hypothetical protein
MIFLDPSWHILGHTLFPFHYKQLSSIYLAAGRELLRSRTEIQIAFVLILRINSKLSEKHQKSSLLVSHIQCQAEGKENMNHKELLIAQLAI